MQKGQGSGNSDAVASFVGEMGSLEGVTRIALLDDSGRVLATQGFEDRDELMEAAALTAGMCGAGMRLCEVLGVAPAQGISVVGSAAGEAPGTLRLLRIPGGGASGSTMLLAATEAAAATVAARLEDFSGSGGFDAEGPREMVDPDAFGDSLIESLDRLFP